jgi:hypothetical protein
MRLFAFCVYTLTVYYAKQDNSGANFKAVWQFRHSEYFQVLAETLQEAVSLLEKEVLVGRNWELDPRSDAHSDSGSWHRPSAQKLTEEGDLWLEQNYYARRFLLFGGELACHSLSAGVYAWTEKEDLPADPLNELLGTEAGKIRLPALVG